MNAVPHPEQKKPDKELVNLLNELECLNFPVVKQETMTKGAIARSLDAITGRAMYELEMSGDDADRAFAKATIHIAKLVAEFEELRPIV